MKKRLIAALLATALCLLCVSCSKEAQFKFMIVGKWQQMEIRNVQKKGDEVVFSNTMDMTKALYIEEFKSDGTLLSSRGGSEPIISSYSIEGNVISTDGAISIVPCIIESITGSEMVLSYTLADSEASLRTEARYKRL